MSDDIEEWTFPRGKGPLVIDPWKVPTQITAGMWRDVVRFEPCQNCGQRVAIRRGIRRVRIACSNRCDHAIRAQARERDQRPRTSLVSCQVCGVTQEVSARLASRTLYCSRACEHVRRVLVRARKERADYDRRMKCQP